MNTNPPAEQYIVIPGWRKRANVHDVESQTSREPVRRLPGTSWMPTRARNHFIAVLGEFVGTFSFLFFALSAAQVANATVASSDTGTATTSDLLFIALGFGFSLAANIWVFFRISGGLFNPAVTLGLCLIGALGWVRGSLVFIIQIIGGIAAAGIVSALFPGPMSVRTTLSDGTSVVRGLFIEMFLTALLVFTVFMLAAEKHKSTFLAPIGIGLALFVAELPGVYFTGGSLNPARSFGPDVVLGHFDGYHWIYWVGPGLGSIMAVVMYRLIKSLEYETANPGQDFDENEIKAFQPARDPPSTREDVRRPGAPLIQSGEFPPCV
ncbi:Aquaporin-1 [Diplodia seriata]|uniref:Aquaporin-1 n=1 Tax=Diplodia seriata TaxID=420778 RepID=A0A1S8BAC2_9PEZI|nr:Aquaporin-1 [Diplodia seriata]